LNPKQRKRETDEGRGCGNPLLAGFFWSAIFLVLIFGGGKKASAGQPLEPSWQALQRGEAAALLRHALAPGTGDPAGFSLRDCATQRNLSEGGRTQARRIGDFFRIRGIKEARVYSSQWCRCLETARLLGLGPVEERPALNSFFGEPGRGPEQTAKTRAFLSTLFGKKPAILVTHQVNITALTRVFPSSGETIIFQMEKNGAGKVLGRFTLK
jgi:phosphohistidine phosphatase SixA